MAETIKSNLSDDELEEVVGGTTREYRAAWDIINGVYGTGAERYNRLNAAGINAQVAIDYAGALSEGFQAVINDVINGRYGNGQDRVNALSAAGYNPAFVQSMVNAYLMNS